MKKKLNKPELEGYRKGLPKPVYPTYTKSGGAIGDRSMEVAEEFMQTGSGVDDSKIENVDACPNEKFLNSNKQRFDSKGQVDAAGREVFGNYPDDLSKRD